MKHGARKPVLVRPAGGTKSEINVTPLVDVVLVLLIIFMVVTPLLEKDFAVRIPSTEQVETTSEVPPDQIVVRIDGSGEFRVNGEITAPAAYVQSLKDRLDPRAPADRIVFITPEDEASYPKLVEALEGARRAGAETLGMTAEPAPPLPVPMPGGTEPAPAGAAPAPAGGTPASPAPSPSP
jgi:biopolymer transport protein ExbD